MATLEIHLNDAEDKCQMLERNLKEVEDKWMGNQHIVNQVVFLKQQLEIALQNNASNSNKLLSEKNDA